MSDDVTYPTEAEIAKTIEYALSLKKGDWAPGEVICALAAQRDALRAEVAYVRGIMTGQEVECRAREEGEKVWQFRVELLNREVRRLRAEVTRLREIEVSDEVYGIICAQSDDSSVVVCGEFKSGREFREKFRIRPAPSADDTKDAEIVKLRTEVERLRGQINAAKEEAGDFCKPPLDGTLVTAIKVISMRCGAAEARLKELEAAPSADVVLPTIRYDAETVGGPTRHPGQDVVTVPELTDDEADLVVTEFSLEDEWPDDGVSEDFMEYVRWGLTIGMRYMASRTAPSADVVTVPRENLEALELDQAIGGEYRMPDGRTFWIDGPVARKIANRIVSASKIKAQAVKHEEGRKG